MQRLRNSSNWAAKTPRPNGIKYGKAQGAKGWMVGHSIVCTTDEAHNSIRLFGCELSVLDDMNIRLPQYQLGTFAYCQGWTKAIWGSEFKLNQERCRHPCVSHQPRCVGSTNTRSRLAEISVRYLFARCDRELDVLTKISLFETVKNSRFKHLVP